MSITETNLNEALKFLKAKLSEILAPDLGQYELLVNSTVKSTTPSIWIEPPPLPQNYRLRDKSGIECIINREGDIAVTPLLGAKQITQDFVIKLTQYNLQKCLRLPVLKVLDAKYWEIEKDPIIQPLIELSEGFSYPQGIIKLTVSSHF